MNILITGGTGFLGSALASSFNTQNFQMTALSRRPEKVSRLCGGRIRAVQDLAQIASDEYFDVVINLAGAPIFSAPWTDLRKQILSNSRVHVTQQLLTLFARLQVKPELLISGSAIGYYGDQGDEILSETSISKEDFAQQLCADWEATALQAEKLGIRVCIVRTGLVLGRRGGMLRRLLLPFKFGLGGRLGDGRQWMSWIHIQDWVRIIHTMMQVKDMRGSYNATAPHPVTNNEFTRILAALLHRPTLMPLSHWVLQKLLGEMATLVLGSQRVLPERLQQQQFEFQYANLKSALKEILNLKAPVPLTEKKLKAMQIKAIQP